MSSSSNAIACDWEPPGTSHHCLPLPELLPDQCGSSLKPFAHLAVWERSGTTIPLLSHLLPANVRGKVVERRALSVGHFCLPLSCYKTSALSSLCPPQVKTGISDVLGECGWLAHRRGGPAWSAMVSLAEWWHVAAHREWCSCLWFMVGDSPGLVVSGLMAECTSSL